MKFRVARHTLSLDRMVAFYTNNLELEILGKFVSHNNYDGIFLGKKNSDWHLEFTVSDNIPNHQADEDDLLVFYVDTEEKFNQIKAKFEANEIQPVVPINPYWKKDAATYCDPDGFRVVVSFRK
jgi:hypothetical protein